MRFRNRREAGRLLAQQIPDEVASEHPVVVGLPRGGVPVAYELARALHTPLDVIVVRKLGVPFQPELGMGAIGEEGVRVLNDAILEAAHVTRHELDTVERRERAELERRAARYRAGRPMVSLQGRTVIVVDDGLATGGTARAALQVARSHGARRVVLAVPVAPRETLEWLADEADRVVVGETPEPFHAIGEWYDDFTQTSDDEVVRLLTDPSVVDDSEPPSAARDEDVTVAGDGVRLGGHLTVPDGATGVVVFAHGSGSSRHSSRNRSVARVLNDAGLGTLLFDLLTEREAADRANVFDVELLADRLLGATRWLGREPALAALPVGYFGASTGAAAALWAAADPDSGVRAVVSRGGRPDLAGARLGLVRAPTLLVVGGWDDVVVQLNREAARDLRCEHRLEIVPEATHLFEEPGALEQVAKLAVDWFSTHLA
jgi:predicted phosphoribosyltransferase/dienelactone hydrolase